MLKIVDLISVMKMLLLPAATARAIYCVGKIAIADEEDQKKYRERLKNLLVFLVIAESAASVLQIVLKELI